MRIHIFVATTQGLVAIQNITTINDADISSIVSINGTSTTANISSAYHSFVKRGAGIIQQDFGACSYRININKRIDQGNSWQLAFYLAHAVNNDNLLGDGQVVAGDQVICATGEINTSNRNIQAINKIHIKQKLAAEQIKQWHSKKINVSFLVPNANAQTLDKKLPLNIKLVRDLTHALSYLPLSCSVISAKNETMTELELDTVPKKGFWKNKKSQHLVLLMLLLFFTLIVSKTLWFSSDNESLQDISENISVLNNYQQPWQIILLSKPEHEINGNFHAAYALIEKTITEQLIAENFEVADKTLIEGTKHFTGQTLTRLNTHLNNNDINLAIRFSLTVNKVEQLPKLTATSNDTWQYELSAYLIDLASKKKIETHTEYGQYSDNVINCDKPCFSNRIANNARKLAQDMGAILVVKLNNLPPRYLLELTFQSFTVKESSLIYQHLKSLNGYLSAQLIDEFSVGGSLFQENTGQRYSYRSYLNAEQLSIELTNLFNQLDISVSKLKSNKHALLFSRNRTPYIIYLTYGLVLLILVSSLFLISRRRHRVKRDFIPHDVVNHDNVSLLDATPILLKNEKDNANPPLPKDVLQLVLSAIEKKEFYKACSFIDSAIEHLSSQDVHKPSDYLTRFIELRQTTEKKIKPTKKAVVGKGALENYTIYTSPTLNLGRTNAKLTSSFNIGYQHLSRMGNQCRFVQQNNQFFIEDQGSTNGCIFNSTLLTTYQKSVITTDSELIMGVGANDNNIAVCKLDLKIATQQSKNALIMQLNPGTLKFLEQSALNSAWPSMEKDLSSRWVLLAEESLLAISIDKGKVELASTKTETTILAYLIYKNGFYIKPTRHSDAQNHNESITTKSNQLMIDGHLICNTIPINDTAIISINGYEFSLEALFD